MCHASLQPGKSGDMVHGGWVSARNGRFRNDAVVGSQFAVKCFKIINQGAVEKVNRWPHYQTAWLSTALSASASVKIAILSIQSMVAIRSKFHA